MRRVGDGFAEATPDNNAVRASARFARSGVHGAYTVQEGERVDGVERCMAESLSCLAPRREPLNVIRKRAHRLAGMAMDSDCG